MLQPALCALPANIYCNRYDVERSKCPKKAIGDAKDLVTYAATVKISSVAESGEHTTPWQGLRSMYMKYQETQLWSGQIR